MSGFCKIDFVKRISSFLPLEGKIVQLRNQVFHDFFLKEMLALELILLDVGNCDQAKPVLQEEV